MQIPKNDPLILKYTLYVQIVPFRTEESEQRFSTRTSKL